MGTMQRRKVEPFHLDGGSTACLLLHGFAGSPAEVRPLGQYLNDRGITVRAPLLPGHGTHPEELRHTRWPQWVQAAEAERDAMEATHGSVHIVGFSMGGLIALHMAGHRSPPSLVTLSCPSRLADWRQILVPLARHLMPYYPVRVSNPEVAAQLQSYDRLPLDAVNSLVELASTVRRELGRVRAPLLAMQGERDKWIAPQSAAYLLRHVSSGEKRCQILPGRNHLITLEQGREEVFGAVGTWIENHRKIG